MRFFRILSPPRIGEADEFRLANKGALILYLTGGVLAGFAQEDGEQGEGGIIGEGRAPDIFPEVFSEHVVARPGAPRLIRAQRVGSRWERYDFQRG